MSARREGVGVDDGGGGRRGVHKLFREHRAGVGLVGLVHRRRGSLHDGDLDRHAVLSLVRVSHHHRRRDGARLGGVGLLVPGDGGAGRQVGGVFDCRGGVRRGFVHHGLDALALRVLLLGLACNVDGDVDGVRGAVRVGHHHGGVLRTRGGGVRGGFPTGCGAGRQVGEVGHGVSGLRHVAAIDGLVLSHRVVLVRHGADSDLDVDLVGGAVRVGHHHGGVLHARGGGVGRGFPGDVGAFGQQLRVSDGGGSLRGLALLHGLVLADRVELLRLLADVNLDLHGLAGAVRVGHQHLGVLGARRGHVRLGLPGHSSASGQLGSVDDGAGGRRHLPVVGALRLALRGELVGLGAHDDGDVDLVGGAVRVGHHHRGVLGTRGGGVHRLLELEVGAGRQVGDVVNGSARHDAVADVDRLLGGFRRVLLVHRGFRCRDDVDGDRDAVDRAVGVGHQHHCRDVAGGGGVGGHRPGVGGVGGQVRHVGDGGAGRRRVHAFDGGDVLADRVVLVGVGAHDDLCRHAVHGAVRVGHHNNGVLHTGGGGVHRLLPAEVRALRQVAGQGVARVGGVALVDHLVGGGGLVHRGVVAHLHHDREGLGGAVGVGHLHLAGLLAGRGGVGRGHPGDLGALGKLAGVVDGVGGGRFCALIHYLQTRVRGVLLLVGADVHADVDGLGGAVRVFHAHDGVFHAGARGVRRCLPGQLGAHRQRIRVDDGGGGRRLVADVDGLGPAGRCVVLLVGAHADLDGNAVDGAIRVGHQHHRVLGAGRRGVHGGFESEGGAFRQVACVAYRRLRVHRSIPVHRLRLSLRLVRVRKRADNNLGCDHLGGAVRVGDGDSDVLDAGPGGVRLRLPGVGGAGQLVRVRDGVLRTQVLAAVFHGAHLGCGGEGVGLRAHGDGDVDLVDGAVRVGHLHLAGLVAGGGGVGGAVPLDLGSCRQVGKVADGRGRVRGGAVVHGLFRGGGGVVVGKRGDRDGHGDGVDRVVRVHDPHLDVVERAGFVRRRRVDELEVRAGRQRVRIRHGSAGVERILRLDRDVLAGGVVGRVHRVRRLRRHVDLHRHVLGGAVRVGHAHHRVLGAGRRGVRFGGPGERGAGGQVADVGDRRLGVRLRTFDHVDGLAFRRVGVGLRAHRHGLGDLIGGAVRVRHHHGDLLLPRLGGVHGVFQRQRGAFRQVGLVGQHVFRGDCLAVVDGDVGALRVGGVRKRAHGDLHWHCVHAAVGVGDDDVGGVRAWLVGRRLRLKGELGALRQVAGVGDGVLRVQRAAVVHGAVLALGVKRVGLRAHDHVHRDLLGGAVGVGDHHDGVLRSRGGGVGGALPGNLGALRQRPCVCDGVFRLRRGAVVHGLRLRRRGVLVRLGADLHLHLDFVGGAVRVRHAHNAVLGARRGGVRGGGPFDAGAVGKLLVRQQGQRRVELGVLVHHLHRGLRVVLLILRRHRDLHGDLVHAAVRVRHHHNGILGARRRGVRRLLKLEGGALGEVACVAYRRLRVHLSPIVHCLLRPGRVELLRLGAHVHRHRHAVHGVVGVGDNDVGLLVAGRGGVHRRLETVERACRHVVGVGDGSARDWSVAQVHRLVLACRVVGLGQRLRRRRGNAHRHRHAVHGAVGVGHNHHGRDVADVVGGGSLLPGVRRTAGQVRHVRDGGAGLRHGRAHDSLGGLALRGERFRLRGRTDRDGGVDRLLGAVRVDHLHGDLVLARLGARRRGGGEPAGPRVRRGLRGPAGNGVSGGVDRRAVRELRASRDRRVRLIQRDGAAREGFLGGVGRLAHRVLALGDNEGVGGEQIVDAAVQRRGVHGAGGRRRVRGHREGARVCVGEGGHRAFLDHLAGGFIAPDNAVALYRREGAGDVEFRGAAQRRGVEQLVVVGDVQLHRAVGQDRETEVVEVVRRRVHARHNCRGRAGRFACVVVVLLEHGGGERRVGVDLLAVRVRDPHVHARVAGEVLVAGAQGVLAVRIGLAGHCHRDRLCAFRAHVLEHGLDRAGALRLRDRGVFFDCLDALLRLRSQHRGEDVVALEVGVAVACVAGGRTDRAVALERVLPHEAGNGVRHGQGGCGVGQWAERVHLDVGGGHVVLGGVHRFGEEDAGALHVGAGQLEHAGRVRRVLARSRRHADPGVGHDAAGLAGVHVRVAGLRVDQVFLRHPQAVGLLAVAHAGGVEQVGLAVGVVEGDVVALFVLDQVALGVAHAEVEGVRAGRLSRQLLGLGRVDGRKRAVLVTELHEHRHAVETHGVGDARRRGRFHHADASRQQVRGIGEVGGAVDIAVFDRVCVNRSGRGSPLRVGWIAVGHSLGVGGGLRGDHRVGERGDGGDGECGGRDGRAAVAGGDLRAHRVSFSFVGVSPVRSSRCATGQ